MSIIDSWYCQRCGSRNIAGGLTEKCSMCNEPRALPGIAVRDDGAEQIIERLENRIAKLEQEALADEDRMHDALTTIDEQRASINSQTEEILQLQSKLDSAEKRLAEERMALFEEISDLRKKVENREARLKAAESRLDQSIEALRRLNVEASGLAGAFGTEIRECVGNTNMAVLKQRIAEAEAVLEGVVETSFRKSDEHG